jgi:hypothetical protein
MFVVAQTLALSNFGMTPIAILGMSRYFDVSKIFQTGNGIDWTRKVGEHLDALLLDSTSVGIGNVWIGTCALAFAM